MVEAFWDRRGIGSPYTRDQAGLLYLSATAIGIGLPALLFLMITLLETVSSKKPLLQNLFKLHLVTDDVF